MRRKGLVKDDPVLLDVTVAHDEHADAVRTRHADVVGDVDRRADQVTGRRDRAQGLDHPCPFDCSTRPQAPKTDQIRSSLVSVGGVLAKLEMAGDAGSGGSRAGGGIRTHGLLITSELLYP